MKQTKTFIPTTREIPASAEAISHKLLIKAGMVKQVSAGVYTYLPLANNVVEKIKKIIREEHEAIDAAEIVMPLLQAQEYWQRSGRWNKMGDELMRITDRKGAGYAMQATSEEIVCQTVENMLTSYKQLPLTLYQIQTKFRDEVRPRLGLLRCKEFIMKDSYSFHDSSESLREGYIDHFNAYCKIYDRMDLKYRAVQADSGNIGGSYTHEFQALADVGEDTIAYTDESDYAANIETAKVVEENYTMPVYEKKERSLLETPAQETIDEIASYCGVEVNRAMKALALKADGELYLVLMRGNDQLNDLKFKKVTGTSEVEMASPEEIESMGSVVGYMGPFGIKNCRVIADIAVKYMYNHSCGANKKGFHYINVNPGDYEVDGFYDLRMIEEGDLAEDLSGKVKFAKGIEIGQVFELGQGYSKSMGINYLDAKGKAQPFYMGCYGIGVSRLLSAVIEQHNDEYGIIWPKEVAPYQVHLLCLDMKKEEQVKLSEKIYKELNNAKIEVLFDDRNERAGVKFNDADLIGIPLQIIVGKKAQENIVEIKERKTGEKVEYSTDKILEIIKEFYA
ncbi:MULTISPECIES: proline--tRNA ligase [unclassified Gemella]|uniref:proline--tRNA ligase n=1 Tax=unclassified Gemella TaxID=2624949 RepID=UPI001C03AC52|nr:MULTISPECIES: proline--tRNA ligase [unclassified Gemella]MBU0278403.1 proline--tRNA ligase [Gemella sp. zg-1178]QWQ38982.1 proline--tRNA ligase [Gemella sp. zg-570]